MQCPVCITESLVMSERSGIEIDYCPKCRGVWLDRGELDKIIERSEKQLAPSNLYRQERTEHHNDHHERREEYHHPEHQYQERQHYHKKESFWGELFD
ncbi:MAG: zf-TFIIB domain-containing protein [Sulfuricurvum sp.]